MLNTPREVVILRDTKHRTKRRDRKSDAPDMRVVGIDFNPGPDAEERLRRLFTILVRLADDEIPAPGAEHQVDEGGEERTEVLPTGSDGLESLPPHN